MTTTPVANRRPLAKIAVFAASIPLALVTHAACVCWMLMPVLGLVAARRRPEALA